MTNSVDRTAKPAADVVRWQPVGAIDPDALASARLQTINVVQWLARVANSFVNADSADERLMLTFQSGNAVFITKPFADDLALELRLPQLEMQFREGGKPAPHVFDPEARSPAEAEAWLLVELLHRGVDRTKFSKKLPYKVAGLMSGDAEDYSPQSNLPALTQMRDWLRNAAAVLDATARASGDGIGILCWPQTLSLSIGSHIELARANVGFTPGDAQIAEPYFYRRLASARGAAPSRARSVLKASALLGQSDPAVAAIAFLSGAAG